MPLNFGVGKTPENIVKKTNQWIIEQTNPKFSVEAQLTRFKLCERHSWKKALMLEKAEGKGR